MNLLFLVLLGISYALILVAFGYAVTSSGSRLSPSDCGPFTGKDTIYQVVLDSVNTFPDVLKEIIRIISSPAIIALIFVVFGVFIYYYKLLKSSNEQKMKLLRQQIILTGKDKLYLMKKINSRAMEAEQ
ncbi:Hypothetical predicted protein [Paramuricea clavata]|uniref:Uncharacterized protein n=1 Tax=Paramuricea clavata TaxID=317549 RepID=A0A6S7JUB1_PARCT|nr:Hypothetical predicted protein [Paramuricea clavata]